MNTTLARRDRWSMEQKRGDKKTRGVRSGQPVDMYAHACMCAWRRGEVEMEMEMEMEIKHGGEERKDAGFLLIGTWSWSWSWGALTHPMPWMGWMLGHVKMFA